MIQTVNESEFLRNVQLTFVFWQIVGGIKPLAQQSNTRMQYGRLLILSFHLTLLVVVHTFFAGSSLLFILKAVLLCLVKTKEEKSWSDWHTFCEVYYQFN